MDTLAPRRGKHGDFTARDSLEIDTYQICVAHSQLRWHSTLCSLLSFHTNPNICMFLMLYENISLVNCKQLFH